MWGFILALLHIHPISCSPQSLCQVPLPVPHSVGASACVCNKHARHSFLFPRFLNFLYLILTSLWDLVVCMVLIPPLGGVERSSPWRTCRGAGPLVVKGLVPPCGEEGPRGVPASGSSRWRPGAASQKDVGLALRLPAGSAVPCRPHSCSRDLLILHLLCSERLPVPSGRQHDD